MVGFHLMKASFWKARVSPPKMTTRLRLTQSILSTLPWRKWTQMIWATVATMTTTVASRMGATLGSTVAEPSSEATQLAASSGFFSEYLKLAKKRMTGKRSKSSFMAGHYILPKKTDSQAQERMHTVLIVDDSDINLTLIKALVLKLGDCTPVLFDHPVAALEWCRSNVPDLVIVDYMMPEMDGLKFIAAFRALHGRDEIPVLMITANDQRDVRYEALIGGANDFLTKPIDRIEFSARARNMLSIRAGQKYLADMSVHLSELVDERTSKIRDREKELIFRISRAAEFRDPETGAHIQRMAHYSQIIARGLDLGAAMEKLVLEAAPMHDVGKIGIPDYILLKPGKLTPEEFEVMKGHSRIGYELLKDSGSEILQAAAEIALTHHEKFDGSGYPCGLKGSQIPQLGRIVAVADVFDALTSERPYKKAWSLDDACRYLEEGRGTHFDPMCVEAFLAGWEDVLEIRQRFRDEEVPLV